MDWTMYCAIGLFVLTVGSLVMNYFNFVEIKHLQAKALDNNNRIDCLDRRCIQDLKNTDARNRMVKDQVLGIFDTLKYNHLDKKEIYAMWDIHNARFTSLNDSLEGYRSILARLEPLAPLADKFDVKRRMLYNKDYMADLKEELKEIEDELKGIA